MLRIEWVGRVEYGCAWERQQQLVAERTADPALDDHLLLLEHPPTYTLGRSGHEENLLLDEATLRQRGIALYHVDRGGDITYHGPGQLVGYPILNLKRRYGRGIGRTRQYVGRLEQVLIETLAAFDITAGRYEGYRGVWVEAAQGMKKIAAIGVKVNGEGVSSHGFALNVNPDLSYFDGIIPCGIVDHGVTSMARLTGVELQIADVMPELIATIASNFESTIVVEGLDHA